MRLNPYHPPRYWSHLARALFHQGRYRDALEALQNFTAPRVRELAFQVAAAGMLGEADEIAKHAAALRKVAPNFDVERFVDTLPYGDDDDRATLRDALLALV
jgi:adenylate cyclase